MKLIELCLRPRFWPSCQDMKEGKKKDVLLSETALDSHIEDKDRT